MCVVKVTNVICAMQSMSATLAARLHQGIDEHHHSSSWNHLKNDYDLKTIGDYSSIFAILVTCNGKLDCLICGMLFIKEKEPSFNTQSESIRVKPMVYHSFILIYSYKHFTFVL